VDIDGRKVAKELQANLHQEITSSGLKPSLAFILVGNHAPSEAYVRMKGKACNDVGILSTKIELPETVSEEKLLSVIQSLNNDPNIHGILVQMPLPPHISETSVIYAIDPKKDVDCFHPLNVGKLITGESDGFLPCTPYGVLLLLKHYKVETSGKHVVVLGRSNIVGRPLANLLSQKRDMGDATVTLAHSKTKNLAHLCKEADILIAAIGKPHFVTKEMVKQGAVVIDVGINRVDGKIVGDVDFEGVAPLASLITPVPGGVGPMTIAVLLQNTWKSCLIYKNIAD
jgi:methylenetetrahydrofolate dehydrogenase (NADP+)/methenyltetrahydrofolate cyclohydrolase